MKHVLFICCVLIRMLVSVPLAYASQHEQPTEIQYATWKIWEVDRAASIWLIKRYVNEDAKFVFVEKGISFEEMIPFDVPEAELQRSHNLACYQVILRKYKLKEPCLIELGKLIWDIEINFWGEKKFPESLKLKQQCDEIFAEHLSPQDTLEKCFVIFDTFVNLE